MIPLGGYDHNDLLNSVFVLMEEAYHTQCAPLTNLEEDMALDVDPFDGNDDQYTTLSDRFVNGRKPYRCALCLLWFSKCRHRVTTQKKEWTDGPMTFRFCTACSRACADSLRGDGEMLVRRFQVADIVWEQA